MSRDDRASTGLKIRSKTIFAVLVPTMLALLLGMANDLGLAKAKADVKLIVTAVVNYEDLIGVLPFTRVPYAKEDPLTEEEDVIFQKVLSGDNMKRKTFLPPRSDGSRYVDPWGRRYRIWLDHDYDGMIVFNGRKFKDIVIVYSFGENGQDELGAGDDVCSWRE